MLLKPRSIKKLPKMSTFKKSVHKWMRRTRFNIFACSRLLLNFSQISIGCISVIYCPIDSRISPMDSEKYVVFYEYFFKIVSPDGAQNFKCRYLGQLLSVFHAIFTVKRNLPKPGSKRQRLDSEEMAEIEVQMEGSGCHQQLPQNVLAFKQIKNCFPVPFVIYADFEFYCQIRGRDG